MKNKIIIISLLVLISFACQATGKDQYLLLFEEVVNRIETNYFEDVSKNNGFSSLTDQYRSKVKACINDKDFISTINSYLFSFNVSHIGFGKTNEIQKKVSPYLWYEYSPGIDVRLIDGNVNVVHISESNHNKSDITMGDEIIKINSVPVNEILNNFVLRPPDNKRNHTFLKTEEILRHVYGTENENVNLTISNKNNEEKSIALVRNKRRNGVTLFEGFPKVFLEVKSNIHSDSIGYIKFNAFQPPNPEKIIEHINSFKVLPNMIIDLRGNNGGSIEALNNIASELLKNNNAFYNLYSQNEIREYRFSVSQDAYKGNLIVLVDELSISAAEIFSDILQFTGSAKIVGSQTPGSVLSGELINLDYNYSLLLPTQDWIRSDGFRLEGNGVTPDYSVELNQKDLKANIDSQLEFAKSLLN
jgi:C-terminal peptidase prc